MPARVARVGSGYALNRVAVSEDWSPLDIAGLQIWLDASQIPAQGDNTDLAAWSDLSGNARHCTQAVAGDKPHYRVAYQNGLAAVEFDGVSHWMDLDMSGGAIAADDHTIIVAYEERNSASNADQRILHRLAAGLHYVPAAAVTPTAGKIGYYSGQWIQAANAVDGAQVVAWQLHEVGGADLYRNGFEIATAQTHTNMSYEDDAALGADIGGNYPFDGFLFELLFYSPMLSAEDRAIVENYLLAKWGI